MSMKRVWFWLGCVMTVICTAQSAYGEMSFPWMRGDVYATMADGSLELAVLPAWVLSRANALSIITPYPSGNSELKYVTKQNRVVKEDVDLPAEARHVEMSASYLDFILNYRLSRTTRSIYSITENGGYICIVIEGKKEDVRKIKLQGIDLKGVTPILCTLVPRDGKIAVMFRGFARGSHAYYLGAFEAMSGQMCSELVPVDIEFLPISLLWLNDSTLASTAVGRNGGFWSILSLKTGEALAFGHEERNASNFVVLSDGLFTANSDDVLKCLYPL